MRMCRRLGANGGHRSEERPITLLKGYYVDYQGGGRISKEIDNPTTGIGFWQTEGRYREHYYNARIEFTLPRSTTRVRLDCVWNGGNPLENIVAGLYDADTLPPGFTLNDYTTGRKDYRNYTFTDWSGNVFGGYVEFSGNFPAGNYAICVMPTGNSEVGKQASNSRLASRDFVVTATY